MRMHIATGITAASLAVAALAQTAPAPRQPSAIVTLPAPVTALAPLDGAVAAGTADGGIAIWNGRDASAATTMKPHVSRVIALGTNAKREVLSVGEDGSLARSSAGGDTQSSPTRLDVGPGPIRAAAFSSDGALLATGGDRGELRIFDVGTGALKRTIQGHRIELHALAMHPGAAVLASASAEGDLRIWDIATGRKLWSMDLDLALFALAFDPREGGLASGGVGRRLTFHDPATYRAAQGMSLPRPRMIATLAWAANGDRIAVGDIDDESLSKGGIELVDARRRAVVATLDTGGTPASAVVFASDALIVGAIGKDLRSWTAK